MPSVKRAPHILVAEPEQNELEMILESLRNDPLLSVSFGRVGTEVIDLLKRSGRANSPAMPSVLLLGLGLEGPGSLELIHRLRDCPRTSCLPIVVLSRSADKEALEQAYAAGANSCLVKPANRGKFDEMIQRVTQYWLKLNQLPHNPGAEPA